MDRTTVGQRGDGEEKRFRSAVSVAILSLMIAALIFLILQDIIKEEQSPSPKIVEDTTATGMQEERFLSMERYVRENRSFPFSFFFSVHEVINDAIIKSYAETGRLPADLGEVWPANSIVDKDRSAYNILGTETIYVRIDETTWALVSASGQKRVSITADQVRMIPIAEWKVGGDVIRRFSLADPDLDGKPDAVTLN